MQIYLIFRGKKKGQVLHCVVRILSAIAKVEIKSLSDNGNRTHNTYKFNCVWLSILIKIHRTIEIGLDAIDYSFAWFRTFGFDLF